MAWEKDLWVNRPQSPPHHRRLFAVELGAFGFFGHFWGTFAVLLADPSASLGLSPGPLGWQNSSACEWLTLALRLRAA
jgi:hypothetical protein